MTEAMLGIGLLTTILFLLSLGVLAARSRLVPSGAVTVTVNGGRSLSARTGTKLLPVLLDAGIAVPSSCGGSGTCGLCRVIVASGAGLPLPTETSRFSRKDIRDGWRLACQVSLRGDMAITVSEALFGAKHWTCTVLSSRMLSPLIRELVLSLPADADFTFRAGGFVQVTAPPHDLSFAHFDVGADIEAEWDRLGIRQLQSASREPVKRAYSVANVPDQKDRIVLLIRLALPPPAVAGAPPGIVSSYLFSLTAGDSVEVEGPYGEFAAQDGDREMIFIGGGVGMAPLRAIFFDQLERVRTSRRMSFWYGARTATDLFYVEEFDELSKRHENFDWTVALSDPQPQDNWTGATGFVHDVVFERYLSDHPAPEDCEYYLCGPPLMIKAVVAMLDSLGVDPDAIFFDDFGS